VARAIHLYDPPERFVTGTVGMPGERTFYLQARAGARLTSVALEKAQVAVLADRMDAILDELMRRPEFAGSIPAVVPQSAEDDQPLEQPILEEFRVGVLALAWESDAERIMIEAQAATEQDDEELADDDDETAPDLLRVLLTAVQARAFSKRARIVVGAGRQPCPFCSLPLDPEGHVCPRANGYRR
jgi:uncharacterized repeat protein (TIGR03847 family)